MTGVQRRDPEHEPGDAGLHVLGEPRGNLAGRSEDRRLIDVEARAVVAVEESAQRVARPAAVVVDSDVDEAAGDQSTGSPASKRLRSSVQTASRPSVSTWRKNSAYAAPEPSAPTAELGT